VAGLQTGAFFYSFSVPSVFSVFNLLCFAKATGTSPYGFCDKHCLPAGGVMRKWGIVISVFYALILLGLIVPFAVLLSGRDFPTWGKFFGTVLATYQDWLFWILAGAILVSQALLLFLSVDTSQKRLKPRTHILVSIALGALLTAMLTTGAICSLGVAVRGDKFIDFLDDLSKRLFDNDQYFASFWILMFWGTLWLVWAILFYFYLRNSSAAVTRLISWLLKGSVLELLIVVPCHVIVRRRHDCSAPTVTSFGIATGIAIMLLAFGPSVLFLYKKRLDSYRPRPSL
jgi:hypothetical protein